MLGAMQLHKRLERDSLRGERFASNNFLPTRNVTAIIGSLSTIIYYYNPGVVLGDRLMDGTEGENGL